jgi:hypothetical protein
MEYTDGQKAAFKEEFTRRRRRQLYATVPLVALALPMIFLADGKVGTAPFGVPVGALGPAFFALVLAVLAFSWRNWRCPACDRYLGKGMSPKFCPGCGAELQ